MRSKLRLCFYALFMFSLFGAVPAWAQNGSITGLVTEGASSQGVSTARVEAVTADGRVVATTQTNAVGRYRLSVPAGSYTVRVQALGFEEARSASVTVSSGGTATADLSLRVAAFEMNPVVISVSRQTEKATEAPSRVEVVSEQEIRVRPAVTPVDHLRSMPGIDVITTGVQSTNVAARGFNNIFSGSLHTLTDNRIAGIPSLRVNLMHFTPQTNEDLSRIEVVLGPGSALYGPNTANGVLHMITKSPLLDEGTVVSIAGGQQDMLHGTLRTSKRLTDNFGIKFSGQYIKATEFFYTDSVEIATRTLARSTVPANQARFRASLPRDIDGTPLTADEVTQRIARIGERDYDIERWSGDVRADWRVTSSLVTSFNAGLTNSGSGIELTGIGAGQIKNWKYGYYQARANMGRLFAQAYLNTSDAGDTYLLRSGGPIVDKSKVFVTQLQHGMNFMGWQDFTYGVDYVSTMPNTEGTINGNREDNDNYNEFGAYLQSRTDITSKLNLVLAGRGDRHSELDKWVFSPRAALVFNPTDNQSMRVSFNRAFSTPSSLNLFLDIDGGPGPSSLGPLGFRLRAQGPGADGINFRDANGTLYGIRSPFAAAVGQTSTSLLAPTAQTLYDLQREGFFGAAAAQGAPIPASLQAYLRGLRADPALGAITTYQFDPILNTRTEVTASSLAKIPGIEESTAQTFEVGYQGVIGGKLQLAVDAWTEKRSNFVSPLILQSPLALLNPAAYGAFLVQRLTPVVGAAQAGAIATQMASVPAGVFSSPEIDAGGADLLVTYRNFGEVKLNGFDLSGAYLLTDKMQIAASASFVSDYYFTLPVNNGANQPVALNAPKEKGNATFTYRDNDRGFNGEFRVRFNGEFPANSAGYIGLACIPGNTTISGPCVKSYTLADLNLGYNLPQIRGASIQLNVSNLFDEPYQSFIGVATVGRLALLRLRYEF